MVPVAVLVKTTSKGCKPDVGVAVKLDTGAGSTGSVGAFDPPPPQVHKNKMLNNNRIFFDVMNNNLFII